MDCDKIVNCVNDGCLTVIFEYDKIVNELKSKIEFENSGIIIFQNAIWDTGATITSVPRYIAESLNLEIIGKEKINPLGNELNANVHIVNIILGEKIKLPNRKIYSVAESNENIIGMDIIQNGNFFLFNNHNKTTFKFCVPSLKTSALKCPNGWVDEITGIIPNISDDDVKEFETERLMGKHDKTHG